ncbi:CHASE3 domain-containing protein [Sphingomonas rhizophila]|uniref:histidine kinase n=1 Tax=Sphingomonas rhizophila TaxID=2071607 RepID=A0A7G9S8E9_9SPHN|nr:sensor histidine kinase [Sphingomonas rhizophila]QNN64124.1 CHASE3 domain-containing protein [Sphingomonas rhizophila]
MAQPLTDDRRFTRNAGLALAAGFGLVLVALILVAMTYDNARRLNDRVEHTHRITDNLSQLILAVERNETATRGYLLSPAPLRIQTRRDALARIGPLLTDLRRQLADNPEQARRLDALRPLIREQVATTETLMGMALAGDFTGAQAEFGRRVLVRRIEDIRAEIGKMQAVEAELLRQRIARESGNRDILQAILLLTALLFMAVGVATYLLVRRYTSDLAAARDRLHLLNTDLEAAVAERTADLRRANEEIQRFAYIVSHDLRSPLVNVMGFTAELDSANWQIAGLIDRVEKENPDLLTPADRTAALEDLPEAVGFIRSSTQKMDRLINAILDLSRQGKRVLAPQELDMKEVLTDIAHSLDTLATERGAHFVVEEPLPTIRHDRLAIDQIFSNLMENATKYLVPGRPGVISVRGKLRGKRAIFEVQDNGRGIAPEDTERVFELFRRAGAQDQAGEGIGLANVRALAYRLGGTVSLRSALGEGSTFVVDLPVEFAEEGKIK